MKKLITRSALLALALAAFSTARAAEVTFSLDTKGWTDQPKNVYAAGSFNNWTKDKLQLTDPDGDRVWTLKTDIPEGRYIYKFVIDVNTPSERFINDPAADKALEEPDGFGGNNSGMMVGPDARKLPAPQPNAINKDGVSFDPKSEADLDVGPTSTRVRVRTQINDVDSVSVSVRTAATPTKLRKLSTDRGYDVWGGEIIVKPPFQFAVALTDGTAGAAIDANGIQFSNPDAPVRIFYISVKSPSAVLTPDWAKDAQWYQIFVERFRNGDTSNDPGDFAYERLVPWNGTWFSSLPGEAPGMENFYNGEGNVWKRRYGGDLAGVKEKLPYLRSIGINAIYLNPIFEAESMHKYDTADYRHIDDNFGKRDENFAKGVLGNRQFYNLDGTKLAADYKETEDPSTWRWTASDLVFLDFLKEAHAQGFHVVLDGVFNHVGTAHPFFQDVIQNGQKSKYADWFEVREWPKTLPADPKMFGKDGGLKYNSWGEDSSALPVFAKNAETGLKKGPADHINAITKRWLDPDGKPDTRDGIDGWRLDVANDIPHPFWIQWRKVVKAANPEAIIIGEIWTPSQAWVSKGDQFDAVMNYQFAMAAQGFFVNVDTQTKPTAFNDKLVGLYFLYPHDANAVMQNLFDSHDTDRAASMFVNPDRAYDSQNRPQDNAKERGYSNDAPTAEQWQRFLQMVAFQQTFIGAPMTYYGNEAGMWSADDPSDRQPFPWADKGPYEGGVGINKNVADMFTRLIATRAALPELRHGDFFPVKKDDANNVYAFGRSYAGKSSVIVLNRSDKEQKIELTDLPSGSYVNYLDDAALDVTTPQVANVETPMARPDVAVKAGTKPMQPADGKMLITLPPYSTAILANVR